MKTLVVEDIKFLAIILERLLGPFGSTDAAFDGEEALEKYLKQYYRKEPYDLICLDIMMPKMNGFEVLEYIRKFELDNNFKKEDKVKIVMISSLNNSNAINRSMESGCDGYITKPYDRERIFTVVKDLGLLNDESDDSDEK